MKPHGIGTITAWRFTRSRRLRALVMAIAALPLLQTTGCYPDWLGALNFQTQLFFTSTFVTAFNTFVMNLLHL